VFIKINSIIFINLPSLVKKFYGSFIQTVSFVCRANSEMPNMLTSHQFLSERYVFYRQKATTNAARIVIRCIILISSV